MPKLSMGEMWPMRGATLGFTWPCLMKMTPTDKTFPNGIPLSFVNFFGPAVTADATQTGTVHCDPSEPTWFTHLWVYFLVFEHFALTILLLVWGAVKLYGVAWPKPDKSYKDKKGSMAGPYWPALLVAALPVLSVASFGEIAQHIFDNWLYLGLVPSYYLAVFYSGLVLGSGMLALGIWDTPKGKPSKLLRAACIGVPASALIVFALIAGAYNRCNGLAQHAASAKNPNGGSAAFEKCMSDPILLLIVWVVTFGALGFWTITLFFVSNAKNQFKCGSAFFFAMVFLAVGIVSSIFVTGTGHQFIHVFIAGGFVGLFFTELIFIIYVVPDSYNTGSNQASV